MPEGVAGALLAFCWGLAGASGLVAGTILGLTVKLSHRVIAGIMSFGAGVLLYAASIEIAAAALAVAGAAFTGGAIIAGAAMFSIANAALAAARDRKRCGECKAQPSEAGVPGSGASIALGTALDAVPEALILGITLRVSGPDLALVTALALSNVPEALSGTAGMRHASRSSRHILVLWGGIAVGAAATTALAYSLLAGLGAKWTAILEAFGSGALIGMAAETMIPEAFHGGPRYSGVLAATGFAAIMLLSEVAR